MAKTAGFSAPSGFRESPTRALNVGEVVASTYQIKDEIARTDTGVVFEARDMLLDRPVAFKLAWRDPGTKSLLKEARRCAAVRARCSVAVHGMGQHNGVEYVVAERVVGPLLGQTLNEPIDGDTLLARFRLLVGAVAAAHDGGVAVGDVSGATVMVAGADRLVLGRLSMSQVPAFGRHGQIMAPEVARGQVTAADPAAAEMIDVYQLGCVAIELARGVPPFASDDLKVELGGHAAEQPPRLADLRPDLPNDASELVEWLLAKKPTARPRNARDVLDQLDAIIDRAGSATRPIRVLVVEPDTSRARVLWSLARRAHPATIAETANNGTEAAHKLNRDHPDVIFVSAQLQGAMNTFELCMYARGLADGDRYQIVVFGDIADRDRQLLDTANVTYLANDGTLPHLFLDRVRLAVTQPRLRYTRRNPITVSG